MVLVAHVSVGKAYVYRPLVQRESTFRKLAGGFLDQVFDGALGEYVARALQSRKHSLQELEELEQMIGEAKKRAKVAAKPESGGAR
jgi:predicted transcriptional regulator